VKNLDYDAREKLESQEVIEFQMLEMYIGVDPGSPDGYFITNCEAPQLYASKLYDSRAFTAVSGKYSSRSVVDNLSFKIDNADDYFTPIFIAGEPEGSYVVIRRYWLTPGVAGTGYFRMVEEPIIIFVGNIDSWTSEDGQLSIKLKSEFSQWNQITLRIQSSSCPWKVFKGTECQYAGSETWCDRTYTRCVALANTANFGGDRWVASIIDKVIWWGRAGG
jgi:hypothetical protein